MPHLPSNPDDDSVPWVDELVQLAQATEGARDDFGDDAIDFEQKDSEEQDSRIHKFKNIAAICTQPSTAMKNATWTEEPCQEITYNIITNGVRAMAKCDTRFGGGLIKTGLLEVARMLNSAAVLHTQLCCTASELEWHERTGDTDLTRLGKTRTGASIKTIAQKVNIDLAHIGAIIATLLAASATNVDGTFLEQHDMHGESTPARRTVP